MSRTDDLSEWGEDAWGDAADAASAAGAASAAEAKPRPVNGPLRAEALVVARDSEDADPRVVALQRRSELSEALYDVMLARSFAISVADAAAIMGIDEELAWQLYTEHPQWLQIERKLEMVSRAKTRARAVAATEKVVPMLTRIIDIDLDESTRLAAELAADGDDDGKRRRGRPVVARPPVSATEQIAAAEMLLKLGTHAEFNEAAMAAAAEAAGGSEIEVAVGAKDGEIRAALRARMRRPSGEGG